jgi:SAM-dependent methyltransferase
MSLPRAIEPEWLDRLPGEDPEAQASRRDLRRLNALMLHSRIIAGAILAQGLAKPRSVIEIGAGDGAFMLSLARQLAGRWPDVTVTLLDRLDLVGGDMRERFAGLGWQVRTIARDVFEFFDEQGASFDIVVANLFLHHFPERDLVRLFSHAARLTRLFVTCEPRRSFPVITASRLVGAIGCNRVSRHDAFVSARAGFRGEELSALWPKGQGWQLAERPAGLFSHCFVARHDEL